MVEQNLVVVESGGAGIWWCWHLAVLEFGGAEVYLVSIFGGFPNVAYLIYGNN